MRDAQSTVVLVLLDEFGVLRPQQWLCEAVRLHEVRGNELDRNVSLLNRLSDPLVSHVDVARETLRTPGRRCEIDNTLNSMCLGGVLL